MPSLTYRANAQLQGNPTSLIGVTNNRGRYFLRVFEFFVVDGAQACYYSS